MRGILTKIALAAVFGFIPLTSFAGTATWFETDGCSNGWFKHKVATYYWGSDTRNTYWLDYNLFGWGRFAGPWGADRHYQPVDIWHGNFRGAGCSNVADWPQIGCLVNTTVTLPIVGVPKEPCEGGED